MNRHIKPAIVVVGYNRVDSLRRLLISIEDAYYPFEDVDLVISLDKGNNQKEVIQAANEMRWTHGNKSIRAYDERQGLRKHVLQCGDLTKTYGAVIILEDDLVVSKSFYIYTLKAASYYYDDDNICGIALYSHSWNGYAMLPFTPNRNEYDVYCGQFSITWGQCWTDRQWKGFRDWYASCESLEDQNDIPADILRWGKQSWGKYFISYIVDTNKYYVIPYTALSTNYSEVGQHNSVVDTSHQVPILDGVRDEYFFPSFDSSVKYDVYFERIFDDSFTIEGIKGSEICVNLNGTKQNAKGKKFILSTHKTKGKLLQTYGLSMRPIEMNVINNLAGTGIFLTEIDSENLKIQVKNPGNIRRRHELYQFYWGVLFREGIRRLFIAIKKKVGEIIKK